MMDSARIGRRSEDGLVALLFSRAGEAPERGASRYFLGRLIPMDWRAGYIMEKCERNGCRASLAVCCWMRSEGLFGRN